MIARLRTFSLSGVEARAVDVEVKIRGGPSRFTIIGLGDVAVRESRERITTALKHAGFRLPKQILVNLAPAGVKKEGSGFDLPIAAAILVASGQIPAEHFQGVSLFGELSLDGGVKPVRGAINLCLNAFSQGITKIILPLENLAEVSILEGLSVCALSDIGAITSPEWRETAPVQYAGSSDCENPFFDVWGQQRAKRALAIAAAGGHNLLMLGPPGCGKSMLAARFLKLLPRLTREEMLEVVKIHSIVGAPLLQLLKGERPFRAPHHHVSDQGFIGGGSPPPLPGEMSLAHNGVIFLDELPEFRRSLLESLRVPIETGKISLSRAKATYEYPSRVQLIAAMNLCPCGRQGTSAGGCRCSPGSIQHYLKKISQPILDRFDLHVELNEVPLDHLVDRNAAESEARPSSLCATVASAREKQILEQGKLNAYLESREIKAACKISVHGKELLQKASERYGISARGFAKILKVAKTIGVLEGACAVEDKHIAEAVSFRSLDRMRNDAAGY
jgi:magnesium chelatase family protein